VPTALLLSGVGRYADPWHPFAETSAVLATAAAARGFDVTIAPDVDAALAALETGALPDLLLADLGKPVDGMPSPASPAGLERALASVPLLALHAAANSFPDSDAWEAAIGARWIDGESWHPDRGATRVSATAAGADLGLADFDTVDERYHRLRPGASRTVLLEVPSDDAGSEPVAWVVDGTVRRAYSALGHDAEAYAAAPVRALLETLIGWVARR
jgi:hypothetical protein